MNENQNIPTQDELDACTTMQDKFRLRRPELFSEMNEREVSRLFSEVTHPYFIFNITRKQWMYYNGKYWEEDIGGVRIQREMKIFSFELSKYAINEVGHWVEQQSGKRLSKMLLITTLSVKKILTRTYIFSTAKMELMICRATVFYCIIRKI